MKFIKFRIYNYKSIKDSGDCYLSDKLTIFAGKNESGKTSILEALSDCHKDKTIREEAYPIDDNEASPYIDLYFELTKKEVEELYKKSGVTKSANKATICIRKTTEPSPYSLISADNIELDDKLDFSTKINDIKTALEGIDEHNAIEELDKQTPQEYKEVLNKSLVAKNIVVNGRQTPFPTPTDKPKIQSAIKIIEDYLNDKSEKDKFLDAFIETKLPYFIMFSSFGNTFPDELPIAGVENNEWAKNLEKVSDFKISEITNSNAQQQRNHQQKVNNEFTKKFKEFWTQDDISLEVDKDGDKILFWILENEQKFKPSQRSKGQQWYLSFYITIVAHINDKVPNILLIDEPGLYLHAQAQKDLLNVLAKHSNDYPVLFSTHSPYLITEDNLENIRLVEKEKNKTKILPKIHSKADAETLTPILTAIGLGLNDSITNLDQKNNIVVEGLEDVFYLQAFNLLHTNSLKANFVNGGGAGNMGKVGAILTGWGCSVRYLFDRDQGKKDGEKNLKEVWGVGEAQILTVTDVAGGSIADVLSNDDFKKFVLDDENVNITNKNSDYIKKAKKDKKVKIDKVLLARLFLQKAKNNEVSLSVESKENIKKLFEKLKEAT